MENTTVHLYLCCIFDSILQTLLLSPQETVSASDKGAHYVTFNVSYLLSKMGRVWIQWWVQMSARCYLEDKIQVYDFIPTLAVLPGGLAKRCISGAINQHACLKPRPTGMSTSIPLRKEKTLIGRTEQRPVARPAPCSKNNFRMS